MRDWMDREGWPLLAAFLALGLMMFVVITSATITNVEVEKQTYVYGDDMKREFDLLNETLEQIQNELKLLIDLLDENRVNLP